MPQRYQMQKPPQRAAGPLFSGFGRKHHCNRRSTGGLQTALAEVEQDELLVVSGSLYLVGYLRPFILDFAETPRGKQRGS